MMTTTMWTCKACEGTGRCLIHAQSEAHPRVADPPRCLGTGKVPHVAIRPTYPPEKP